MQVKTIIKMLQRNPLGELYIAEALSHYSKQVEQDDSDWGNSFINKAAWQSLANQINQAMKD